MNPYTDRLRDWPKPPIPLSDLEDILWLLGSERQQLSGWVLVPPWMVRWTNDAMGW